MASLYSGVSVANIQQRHPVFPPVASFSTWFCLWFVCLFVVVSFCLILQRLLWEAGMGFLLELQLASRDKCQCAYVVSACVALVNVH